MSCSPLTAADVEQVYEQVLGRAAGEAEVEHWLRHAADLRALLQAVFDSEEHRRRVALLAAADLGAPPVALVAPPMPVVANVWHRDLDGFGHPAGTVSPDGVAQVGRAGWLFLVRGTNAVLDQYRGETVPADGWLERWQEAIAIRRDEAAGLGAAYAGVIVPDKLGVVAEHFPQELPTGVRSPAARLAAHADLGLLYPVDALRAVAAGAYLRTDTHLTYAGNAALARAVAAELGATLDAAALPSDLITYPMTGDLGNRFLPPVVEVAETPDSFGAAQLIEDNREEIAAVGGHIGTRRVLRNPSSADPRTVVVYGDSYAFPAPHYQGLAWFLAQVFREVHSVWVPFGWDRTYAERVGAEVVVCQAAERFVIRPPSPRVDALALAEQTIARRRGIAIEQLG